MMFTQKIKKIISNIYGSIDFIFHIKKYRGNNSLGDVTSFIASWNESKIQKNSLELIQYSDERINEHGERYSLNGAIFTPNDAQFLSAIEAGVRNVVLLLTQKYGWITYNSCQSHLIAHTWRIGILPRSQGEYTSIEQKLYPIIKTLSEKYRYKCTIKLEAIFLFDELTKKNIDVLDITIKARFSYFIGRRFIFMAAQDLENILLRD